jgi:predicted XRE-type DNA-binding protein
MALSLSVPLSVASCKNQTRHQDQLWWIGLADCYTCAMTTPDLLKIKSQIIARITGTQSEVANALGISQPYWHQILRNKREPSIDLLSRMAELAGGELSVKFILENSTKKNSK